MARRVMNAFVAAILAALLFAAALAAEPKPKGCTAGDCCWSGEGNRERFCACQVSSGGQGGISSSVAQRSLCASVRCVAGPPPGACAALLVPPSQGGGGGQQMKGPRGTPRAQGGGGFGNG
jgi:hypothetical protein